jgi:hypothetical protein
MHSMTAIFRPQALSLLVALFALLQVCNSAPAREIVVASSNNVVNLNIDALECISLRSNSAKIFGKSYSTSDEIKRLVGRRFPTAKISLDDPLCPFAFGFNIIKWSYRAIRYGRTRAKIVASMHICEWDKFLKINVKRCFAKELYFFEEGIDDLQLMGAALQAFPVKHIDEWSVIKVDLGMTSQ